VLATAQIINLNTVSFPDQKKVGFTAWKLNQLYHSGFATPDLYLLSLDILQNVLDQNTIGVKIKQLVDLTAPTDPETWSDLASQIQGWIKKIDLPTPLAQELINLYYQQLGGEQVAILTSYLKSENHSNLILTQGDANLIQTILEVLAKLFDPSYLQDLVQSNYQLALPATILLFKYQTPVSSGLVFSRHPESGDKHKIVINAGKGHAHIGQNFSENHEFDIYSGQIVSNWPNKQNSSTKLLTDSHIHQLSELILQIKKKQLDHLIAEWVMDQDQPRIIRVFNDPFVHQSDQHQGHIPAQVLVPGSVFGHLVSKNNPTQPSGKLIFYFDQLLHHHLELLDQVSGLILSRPPTQLMLEVLKSKKIPTFIVSQLPPHLDQQYLHLDSNHSVIKKVDRTIDLPDKKLNQLKLLAITTPDFSLYPDIFGQTDATIIDSNLVWQQLKIHPQKLIEKKQQKLFFQKLYQLVERIIKKQSQPLIFRSLSLDQNQLSQYKNGQEYQLIEPTGDKGSGLFIPYPMLQQLELEAVQNISKMFSTPVSWLATMLQTPVQWHFLRYQLDQINQNQTATEGWLEIDNLAMLYQLSNLTDQLDGVVINVAKLNQLLFDYQSATNHHPEDTQILVKIIRENLPKNNGSPVLLMLDRYQQNLIEQLQGQITGLIVPPKIIPLVKNNHLSNI